MKNHTKILIYDILYKSLIGPKPLRVRFDKVDGFIRVYDATRYSVLFEPEKYNAICNRIIYLISLKMVLPAFFPIIMQKSKLIQMIH